MLQFSVYVDDSTITVLITGPIRNLPTYMMWLGIPWRILAVHGLGMPWMYLQVFAALK